MSSIFRIKSVVHRGMVIDIVAMDQRSEKTVILDLYDPDIRHFDSGNDVYFLDRLSEASRAYISYQEELMFLISKLQDPCLFNDKTHNKANELLRDMSNVSYTMDRLQIILLAMRFVR